MKQNEKLILVLAAFSFLAVFVLAQAAFAFFGCIPGPSCYPDTKQGTAACEQQCEDAADYAGCMDDCGAGIEPVEDIPMFPEECMEQCAPQWDEPGDAWAQCMANCVAQ